MARLSSFAHGPEGSTNIPAFSTEFLQCQAVLRGVTLTELAAFSDSGSPARLTLLGELRQAQVPATWASVATGSRQPMLQAVLAELLLTL